MHLTPRGDWAIAIAVIVVVTLILTICLAIGQDRKRDRLNQTGLIPAVSITKGTQP